MMLRLSLMQAWFQLSDEPVEGHLSLTDRKRTIACNETIQAIWYARTVSCGRSW